MLVYEKSSQKIRTRISHYSIRLTTYSKMSLNDHLLRKIHDNPIVCDCSLKIPPAFRDKDATCGAPPILRGAALTSLAGKSIDCGELQEFSSTTVSLNFTSLGQNIMSCYFLVGTRKNTEVVLGYFMNHIKALLLAIA